MKPENKKKCKKCGYEWIAIVENPKICPRCKSYSYNKSRIREKRKSMWNGEKKTKDKLLCMECKKEIKGEKRYIYDSPFCKKCFEKKTKENNKELDRGLKEIGF